MFSPTLKSRFPNHAVTNHEIHLSFKSLGSASLSHCRDDSSQASSSTDRIWAQVSLTLTSLSSSFREQHLSLPAQRAVPPPWLWPEFVRFVPWSQTQPVLTPSCLCCWDTGGLQPSTGRLGTALGFLPAAHGRIIWLGHMQASLAITSVPLHFL